VDRRILVIEDDRDLAHLIGLHLSDLPCKVDTVHDGRLGLESARQHAYDLIILDLMLPNLDGMEICRRLRNQERYTPILMLTSKSTEMDKVLGLEIGADDYMTKPFSVRELQARVKALWRRIERLAPGPLGEAPSSLRVGSLEIDANARTVRLEGALIDVTAREFDLLFFFARHPGRVFTRTQLLEHVWGYQYGGYEHTVNSHINRLRGKIEENAADPKHILTVWGVGYKFADDSTGGD